MSPAQLPLRDVHLPASPPWWPPAPGWWLLAAALLGVLAVLLGIRIRRRARRRRWQRDFDRELAAAGSQAERVAAMSSLLRRAARRIDPGADRLQGEAWLRWLDGGDRPRFSGGPGRLLLEGGFRAWLGPGEVDALEPLARERFLELRAGRR